ncbi:MAG TPA: phospho-N-acetylmuramoyl-pentapeptide-transferase [Planctomycetota bacterium]|jgi:phospho-N-acetylmuramoyl-pentapeptide-transferase|nr:phospho-N-acetylmuramoyl-pentapeptide-transferase [Planctomycetota bacterium]
MLSQFLDEIVGWRLFGYISFRMAMAGFTAFAFALWWGGPTIRWLARHKVGEDVTKTDSPELAEHSKKVGKRDTPTMGGSFLVGSLLASVLLWGRLDNLHVVLAVLLTAGFAAVGFVDDFKKLTIPKSKGLSVRSKMLGLSVVALAALSALAWYAQTSGRGTLLALYPPFLKDVAIGLSSLGLLGVAIFLAFEWLVVVGTSNACNITDGLDGLAAGCMIITGLALSIFCYVTGRPDWTAYLSLPHIGAASEMAVVGGALCGACLGFLWFNAYPAKVFMGDSGSLPLGGLLAWMALVAKQELVLPLLGFVFFAELGSSWLQTQYFRRTGGKRLFTVAPIHHGLQLKGGVFSPGAAPWHEATIVVRAWIVAGVCAIAGLSLMKVR